MAGSIDGGSMAETTLWMSAGVGRGAGKDPRTTEGRFALVSSTCCTVGPDPEVEPWIGSAVRVMMEPSTKSGVTSLVTTSGESVRGGGLTKTGRGEELGG